MEERLFSFRILALRFFITIFVNALAGFLLGFIVSTIIVLFSVPFDMLINLDDKWPVLYKWMMSLIVPATGAGAAWGIFLFFYNKSYINLNIDRGQQRGGLDPGSDG